MSGAADPFASIAQPAPAQTGADPFAAIAQPAEAPTPAKFRQKDEQGLPIMSSHFEAAKYSLGEAAKGVGDVVGGAVEAFDPRRKEGENAFTQLPFVRMAKSAIEPLTHIGEIPGAIKDIADSPSPLHALATVAPRAAGQGIGTYLTGKATEAGVKGLSKVGQLRTGGVQPFVRKFTGVETALKDEVTKAAEKQGEAQAKHAEATDDVAARKDVAKKLDESSMKVSEHIGKVEDSVGREADKKFDAVREKIGNPVIEPAPIVDAVKSAETNILQGIPENIKEFRVIMGHDAIPDNIMDAAEAHGFELGGQEPLTWDKLQSLKSRIDAKLRQSRTSRMNGDVKRALYSVQNSIVDAMGGVAESLGAKELWADAKNFYRQYKEDFHEPAGPSGSGSPVAKALDAVDPKMIRQPFTGAVNSTLGNRGVEILRKYPQHGGNEAAATVEEMLGHHESFSGMPNKATPKPLQTPTVDAQAVARQAIAKKAANWGSFNARDIGILSSGVIGEFLGSLFGSGSWDRIVGAATAVGTYEGAKYGASRALNKPGVIEWLAKTPVEEAAALAKIPGADKVKIVDGLTQIATQTGKPVQLSGPAKQLLGPANVAKIMAAGGAAGATQVKNRKDALDLLNTQPTQ